MHKKRDRTQTQTLINCIIDMNTNMYECHAYTYVRIHAVVRYTCKHELMRTYVQFAWYMHTYMYIHVYYISIYIYIYASAGWHAADIIFLYVSMHIHTYVCVTALYCQNRFFMRIPHGIWVCAYIYIHIHTYIYIDMHIYT